MADSEEDESTETHNILTDSFLGLEEIDLNLYRATELFRPVHSRAVYGGQVVAHALRAAYYTVPLGHQAHSLHCYFLKGGEAARPILYYVDRTREGRTYCNRNVKAIQNGAAIFTMQSSFKKEEIDPYSHQYTMPDVPGPDGLLSDIEVLENQLSWETLAERRKNYITKSLTETMTYEKRTVNKGHVYKEEKFEATSFTWIRALGHIGDNPIMHQCVAVYMSDTIMGILLLPAAPHAAHSAARYIMTSLDHAVWFHSPFRADQWLLYETMSPHCGDGRGMTQGRLWRRDGTLAMSVAQEGVIRTIKSKSNL